MYTYMFFCDIWMGQDLVLQSKPFAFELSFCWANAGFFTFSSKTRSIVPTSNLCRNILRPKNQLNQYLIKQKPNIKLEYYKTHQSECCYAHGYLQYICTVLTGLTT